MRVDKFTREEWLEKYAKDAHWAVFEEDFPVHNMRADFILCVVDLSKNIPIIYSTVSELTAKSVCMEWGGSFPDYRGTPYTKRAFQVMMMYFKEFGYEMVSFLTRNDNYPMLKLGFSAGFKTTGLNTNKDGIFLENTLYFKEGDT